MIHRKDRPGYWFRGKLGGKLRQVSLGLDYQDACRRMSSLKSRSENNPFALLSFTSGNRKACTS